MYEHYSSDNTEDNRCPDDKLLFLYQQDESNEDDNLSKNETAP